VSAVVNADEALRPQQPLHSGRPQPSVDPGTLCEALSVFSAQPGSFQACGGSESPRTTNWYRPIRPDPTRRDWARNWRDADTLSKRLLPIIDSL
jgi:hypothetical protein